MAEETTTTETDIFQQQKKTIDTLIDVLQKQGVYEQQPSQIVYASPSQEPEKKTPNYLLYIGIGILIFILVKKTKLLR